MACNAPVRLELSDGQMAWVRAGSKATTCQYKPIDVVGTTNLPAVELAWERGESGEGVRVIDNTSAIQAAVAANNARYPERAEDGVPIRRRWLRLSGRWRRRRQDLARDVAGRVPAAGDGAGAGAERS